MSIKNTCLTITGTSLSVLGLMFLIFYSTIFKSILKSMIVLKPDSVAFKMWQTNPFAYSYDIYFFNWTNPEDLYSKGIKPKFQELGPYVFQETFERVNISWNDNHTITYDLMQKWHFDKEKSAGNLDVDVITINPLALTTSYIYRHSSAFVRSSVLFGMKSLSSNKAYAKHKLGEVLFDGYPDLLLKIISSFPSLSTKFPSMDKVGYFYKRNNSIFIHRMNVENGNIEDFGSVKRWQFKNHTGVYKGHCGEVRGSAGDFYPPGRRRSFIELFVHGFCRAIKLDYVEDVVVKEITGYKFSGATSMLDNGTLVPENACYCAGENIPSGVLNISSCTYDAPTFMSLPHFYNADPYYTNLVDGLNPQKQRHEMYTILEPTTGFILEMAARFQVNFLVQPIRSTGIFENVPKFYYPAFWVETKITMPDERIWHIKIISKIPLALQVIGAVCVVIGIVLLISSHKSTIYSKLSSETREMKVKKEEEPLHTNGTHLDTRIN